MSNSQPPTEGYICNESSLRALVRTISYTKGKFTLILVRCNYVDLRKYALQQLQERFPGIRLLPLSRAAKELYLVIQKELEEQQYPDALMVLGLESVAELEDLLVSTNLLRNQFIQSFPFPLMLWVNDDVIHKLIKLAPDFNNCASPINLHTEGLVNFLR